MALKNYTLKMMLLIFMLSCSIKTFAQDLIITTAVCNPATEVRLTGPWWGWNPTGGPQAVSNGNGTFTFTLSPAPTADMEYLLVVDGVQENLIAAMQNGGTCAPITDYANYANRIWRTTDPLNISNTYGRCTTCPAGPPLTQMNLPVTFDDPTVEYGLIGFGGAENSSVEPEIGNPTNKVAKVIKSAAAELWAGTTITAPTQLGLATPIPFSTSTKMLLRVFSPDAGIPVRIKVEEYGNPTHSVETEALTTVANQWDTLEFNFANQASGTAALNLTYTYDKVSVFFNFGTTGAIAGEKTYYFDDLKMGAAGGGGNPNSGLEINVEVCNANAPTSVRMTGPLWNWDPNGGPIATAVGGGIWKFTLDPAPTTDMEYLIIVDGVQENLISDMQNGGTCAPVTDYSNYANRKWVAGSGNVTIAYDRCVPCSYPNLSITVEVCSQANQVNLTGPIWSWNPAWGPQGVNNGNGTWTINLSPVPNDTLEYLLVKDGVTENLIQEMQNGGGCAPITDYSSYANRRWIIGQGNAALTYGKCAPCGIGINENEKNSISLYPNPVNNELTINNSEIIKSVKIYSLLGSLINEVKLNSTSTKLNLTNFEKGMYLLHIETEGKTTQTHIIKD
jgi:hypothetical protein